MDIYILYPPGGGPSHYYESMAQGGALPLSAEQLQGKKGAVNIPFQYTSFQYTLSTHSINMSLYQHVTSTYPVMTPPSTHPINTFSQSMSIYPLISRPINTPFHDVGWGGGGGGGLGTEWYTGSDPPTSLNNICTTNPYPLIPPVNICTTNPYPPVSICTLTLYPLSLLSIYVPPTLTPCVVIISGGGRVAVGSSGGGLGSHKVQRRVPAMLPHPSYILPLPLPLITNTPSLSELTY